MPLVTATSTPRSLRIEWTATTTPEGLWAHITNPALLPQWIGRHVGGSLNVGDVLKIDHGEGYVSSSLVRRVQPLEQLTMSWDFPGEQTSELSIVIEPDTESRARLTMEHTGLIEPRSTYLPGWLCHLTYLDSSLSGHPLPPQAFWNLHATLARLTGVPPGS